MILFAPGVFGADRETVRLALEAETIEFRAGDGDVAEDLFNRGLCLPSGTAMTDENLDRVLSVILNCRPR